MSNKWLDPYLSEKERKKISTTTTVITDKTIQRQTEMEDRELTKPSDASVMASYIVKSVRGRKVYIGDGTQLPVWTTRLCEERVKRLIAEGQNHADFWFGYANWQKEQPDKMRQLWATDCLAVLDEAYERLASNAPDTEGDTPVVPRIETLPPAGSDTKPKLFESASTTNKPRLFRRKDHAEESTDCPAASDAGAS